MKKEPKAHSSLLEYLAQVKNGKTKLLSNPPKVSLLGVVALWGEWHIYSGRLGGIVIDLCYVPLFENYKND